MSPGLASAVGTAFVAPCGWQAAGRVGVQARESSTTAALATTRSRPQAEAACSVTPTHLALGLGFVAAAARRGCGKQAARAHAGSRIVRRAEAPKEEPKTPGTPAAPKLPMVPSGDGSIDVMSNLLKERILILGGQVNDDLANTIIAQMLYLAKEDDSKDITIYINSPGGSVSAGFAIYDHMQLVKCDVSTVCFGMAASMGAFLLGAGTKGKRKCFPSSRVMIHQPLGGAGGQAADIEIQAKEILFLRDILNTYLADFTGKPLDQIEKDCDRDYFMTAEEAAEYGIIDEVIATKTYPRLKKPTKPDL